MQFRRIILALALSTTVGLTAACGSDSDGTNQGASGATTSAATTPSAAAQKSNTDEVCKAVVAAYDKEKAELATALTELVTADLKNDAAAKAAAVAKGKVVVDRLTKAANAEIAKATDPQAKATLEQFVTTFSKVLEGKNFDDDAYQAEMDKATAAAEKYCPGLSV